MAALAQSGGEEFSRELDSRLVGQSVNGKYLLVQPVAGEGSEQVFVGRAGQENVDVVLLAGGSKGAQERLAAWGEIAKLSHPNLARVIDSGSCELNGSKYVFAVLEHADENLAEILPQRKLTGEEALAVAKAVAGSLEYLHGHGYHHGHLSPASVLAVRDDVKLSSWQVQPSSEATADAELQRRFRDDVERMGRLIRQVTVGESGAVSGLPATLREVVEHCVTSDPLQRWTAQDVRKFVEHGTRPTISKPASDPQPAVTPAVTNMTTAAPARVVYDSVGNARAMSAEEAPEQADTPASNKRRFVIPAVLTVIIGTGIALTPHMLSRKNASAPEAQAAPKEVVTPSPQSPSAAPPSGEGTTTSPAEKAQPSAPAVSEDGVVSRATPEVSESALRTITGKINVSVKVRVNSAGEVEQAMLVSPGPSRYFAEKAKSAASQWKFAPQTDNRGRAYMLRFTFRRSGVESTVKNS